MNLFIGILIFFVVLFLYLHIMAQYKTSEDLEIYEIDYTTKKQLHEVCDVKQPFLVNITHLDETRDFFQLIQCEKLDGQYDEFEVNIKAMNDYEDVDKNTVDIITLPYRSTRLMLRSDPHAKYISCENGEFIQDTNADALYGTMNDILKPNYTYSTKYDILFGSKLAHTPLKYHNFSNMFLCVTSGKVRVKMTPWKSRKYIDWIKDYDAYEFVSPMNVWAGSGTNADEGSNKKEEHLHKRGVNNLDKIKFVEFDVVAGYVLYIPPYWWYSLQFSGDENTTVCQFTYNTIINGVAHVKDLGLYFLQQSNIMRKNATMYKSKVVDVGGNISGHSFEINPTEIKNEVIDGSKCTSSTPEKVDYIERTHTEVVTNAGVYHVAE